MAADNIIAHLVDRGIIAPEYAAVAARELHRELSRRARRVAITLAAVASEELRERYK